MMMRTIRNNEMKMVITQLRGLASSSNTKRTSLYEFHKSKGGRMVSFAGWDMPVDYSDQGQIASHLHTRTKASIFDVSHMLQFKLFGSKRFDFLESLVVADLKGQKTMGAATLSVFTNEKGGIIDDTVISVYEDHIYVVSNAGCADKDLAHLNSNLKEFNSKQSGDVSLHVLEDKSLIALQGPKAHIALSALTNENLSKLAFMHGTNLKLNIGKDKVQCLVTRCGYTGEDGFEISVPHAFAPALAETLLSNSDVKLAGLGARDSLRLEAGLCLYGNDINEDITPVEAGLTWCIAKRRRAEGGFLGASHILSQLPGGKNPVTKKRIGLEVAAGAPARKGYPVQNLAGEVIGEITSGCPSPSSGKNIAMAYVTSPNATNGTELAVRVRQNVQKATVVKMPFVPTNYYKPQ